MNTLLELEAITKHYPGVTALDEVSLSIAEGEIHALVGENGAGKSTLIKVISGAIEPDSGVIRLDGESFSRMTPALSIAKKVGVIYQEFNLVPSLSVSENVFLGQKIGSKFLANRVEMQLRAESILNELGVSIDSTRQVNTLSVAEQQLVEIAKALSMDAKLLIMDEPSSSIPQAEVNRLLKIVKRLRDRGVSIIYITHKIEEIFLIADRITVLRDGKFISSKEKEEVTRNQLLSLMVGRELKEHYPKRVITPENKVLDVMNLSGEGLFDINFNLKQGEILGIAGLVGAGRTELAKAIFGATGIKKGTIHIHDRPIRIRSPRQAIRNGIGLIPEDRKLEGGFQDYSILWNMSMMVLRRISKFTFLSTRKENTLFERFKQILDIKASSRRQPMKQLSGGNQQKIILARVLAADAEIMIFDEPTRGIDVGAKQEIYKLMNSIVESGKSIIMISSEMEELIGMSDRILVMYRGRITGELDRKAFCQQKILELASGL